MNLETAHAIVSEYSFLPTSRFTVREYRDEDIQVSLEVCTNDSDDPSKQITVTNQLMLYEPDETALRHAIEYLCMNFQQHEAGEWLRRAGVKIRNPHA